MMDKKLLVVLVLLLGIVISGCQDASLAGKAGLPPNIPSDNPPQLYLDCPVDVVVGSELVCEVYLTKEVTDFFTNFKVSATGATARDTMVTLDSSLTNYFVFGTDNAIAFPGTPPGLDETVGITVQFPNSRITYGPGVIAQIHLDVTVAGYSVSLSDVEILSGSSINDVCEDDCIFVPEVCTDVDGDGYGVGCSAGLDCDDGVAACNIDCVAESYADSDSDSFGDPFVTHRECDAPVSYVSNSDDCDDTSDDITAATDGTCDGDDDTYIDITAGGEDCNDDVFACNVDCETEWYLDDDGDGYGDPDTSARMCDALGSYVGNSDDCDDTDSTIHPDAEDILDDGIDQDCDGLDAGLVARYTFDDDDREANIVKDSAVIEQGEKEQNGEKKGATYIESSQCIKNSCLFFDGDNDYVALDLSYEGESLIDALTVCMWFKTSAISDDYGDPKYSSNWALVDFDRDEYYSLFVSADEAIKEGHTYKGGALGFATALSEANPPHIHDFSALEGLNDGDWHFGCGVYNSRKKFIYVDNHNPVIADVALTKGALGTGLKRYGFLGAGSEAGVFDGERDDTNSDRGPYRGYLDEVEIYHRALTESEIRAKYDDLTGGTVSGEDTDGDGVLDDDDSDPSDSTKCQDIDGDTCDDCSQTATSESREADPTNDGPDHDSDGLCDAGDDNDDNDPYDDESDECPQGIVWVPPVAGGGANPDPDGDGCHNDEDTDDDGDGVLDDGDSCPLGNTGWTSDSSTDSDGDGCEDGKLDNDGTVITSEDVDSDGDGVNDVDDSGNLLDACPFGSTGWTSDQATTDNDEDGCRDSKFNENWIITQLHEDLDADNDGFDDVNDAFPLDAAAYLDSDGDGDPDFLVEGVVSTTGLTVDLDDDNDDILDAVDTTGDGSADNYCIGGNKANCGDNCQYTPNKNQEDADNDGVGDACSEDNDGDGILDDEYGRFCTAIDIETYDEDGTTPQCNDVFPLDPTEQVDTDGDLMGDNKDPDADNDGVLDFIDAFEFDHAASVDTDRDGKPDTWNEFYTAADTTTGLVEDGNDDNDAFVDSLDVCPAGVVGDGTATKLGAWDQTLDPDKDGCVNDEDDNDDGDNYFDEEDNCQYTVNNDQIDTDGDGFGDACEDDRDGDGILDDGANDGIDTFTQCNPGVSEDCDDGCPLVPNTNQANNDGDNLQDACDPDDDNDNLPDRFDRCPLVHDSIQLSDGSYIEDFTDTDRDGVLDKCDTLPLVFNPVQSVLAICQDGLPVAGFVPETALTCNANDGSAVKESYCTCGNGLDGTNDCLDNGALPAATHPIMASYANYYQCGGDTDCQTEVAFPCDQTKGQYCSNGACVPLEAPDGDGICPSLPAYYYQKRVNGEYKTYYRTGKSQETIQNGFCVPEEFLACNDNSECSTDEKCNSAGLCTYAVCGNGIIEPTEQCDDSNFIGGQCANDAPCSSDNDCDGLCVFDGCSSLCQIEPGYSCTKVRNPDGTYHSECQEADQRFIQELKTAFELIKNNLVNPDNDVEEKQSFISTVKEAFGRLFA